MTSRYCNGPPIFENQYEGNRAVPHRLWGSLLAFFVPRYRSGFGHGRRVEPAPQSRLARNLLFLFILSWILTLWWGERVVFRRRVDQCAWNKWESWPPEAEPHRVVLLADPQLVDPHTYPGRPWPLSTLTVHHTDMYLRKSFRQIQHTLVPETVFFLGDLFDGGREWSTPPGETDSRSSDKQWRSYGEAFWLKEYYRFSRIFFKPWLDSGSSGQLRKIVAGLPGNHDLGLGMGIRVPVRKRFNAYFGSGNRVDMIGNHTFVSVDTVSLSAKGQPNGDMVDSGDRKPEDIWGPTEDFLSDVKAEKDRMIHRQLRVLQGKPEIEPQSLRVFDLQDDILHLPKATTWEPTDTDIPSILLTHVPLYRASGTPCGPLRERFPQSRNEAGELLEVDDRNAIRVAHGDQYQNVLIPEVSKELIEKIGDVEHVFSGDDHDYCEVVHRGYTSKNGGIREITVKSMSWAMGVRKPGFLMVSLWNPIDKDGKSVAKEKSKGTTIQTHLCLLPDQLSILTRYGYLLALTVLSITISSFHTVYRNPPTPNDFSPDLPLSKPSTTNGSSTNALLPYPGQNGLAARSNAHRARSASPFKGYALPARGSDPDMKERKHAFSGYQNEHSKKWDDVWLGDERTHSSSRSSRLFAVFDRIRRDLLTVAAVALPWYFWLSWTS